jgi:DNA-binding Lrp family transcriptional regulator
MALLVQKYARNCKSLETSLKMVHEYANKQVTMKISERQKQLLAAVEFAPFTPVQELARKLGTRAHTVHYDLQALKEAQVIQLKPLIDVSRLGFQDIGLFFSVAAEKAGWEIKLAEFLARTAGVAWAGSMSGSFQYGVLFYTKQLRSIRELFFRLEKEVGTVALRKLLAPRIAYTRFSRSYLKGKTARLPKEAITLASAADNCSLDQTDLSILSVLARGQHYSLREVARDLGANYSTVQRRVKVLEQQKVIAGYCYEIDTAQLNLQSYKVFLQLSSSGPAVLKHFHAFAQKHARVTYIIETLGSYDLELGLEVEQSKHVNQITAELLAYGGKSLIDLTVLQELDDLVFNLFPFAPK